MPQNVIEHHGILGQRWGIRRYQNKDGSLTPLGKQRQALGNAKRDYQIRKRSANVDKKALKEEYKTAKGKIKKKISMEIEKENKQKAEEQKQREAEELRKKKEQIIKSGNADVVMKNRDILSTQELQQAAARIEIESRINNYSSSYKKQSSQNKEEKTNSGKSFVDTIRKADGDLKTIGSAYNTLANIGNMITGEKTFRLIEGMSGKK